MPKTIDQAKDSAFDLDLVTATLGHGTHLEALAWASTFAGPGDVVEMGAGWFSTPWLHGWCEGTGRRLLTAEVNPAWLEVMRGLYESPWHHFTTSEAPPLGDWALALVDGTAIEGRADWVNTFRGTRTVVVAHDTDARYPGLNEAVALFANHRVFARVRPPTTVVWE